MVINIFYIIGIIGLISIISGTLLIRRKAKKKRIVKIFSLLLLGGICLEIYSIYIKDFIFIALQGIYITGIIYKIIQIK